MEKFFPRSGTGLASLPVTPPPRQLAITEAGETLNKVYHKRTPSKKRKGGTGEIWALSPYEAEATSASDNQLQALQAVVVQQGEWIRKQQEQLEDLDVRYHESLQELNRELSSIKEVLGGRGTSVGEERLDTSTFRTEVLQEQEDMMTRLRTELCSIIEQCVKKEAADIRIEARNEQTTREHAESEILKHLKEVVGTVRQDINKRIAEVTRKHGGETGNSIALQEKMADLDRQLKDRANKEKALEDEIQKCSKLVSEKDEALQKEMQNQKKSFAEMVKGNQTPQKESQTATSVDAQIDALFREQKEREWKKLNLRVIGMRVTKEDNAMDKARDFLDKGLLYPRLQGSLEKAWISELRGRGILHLRFISLAMRDKAHWARPTLKKTMPGVFLDEDLTAAQVASRRVDLEKMKEARSKGLYAVYKGGKLVIGGELRAKAAPPPPNRP